ncbi:MBL fold metallo-hydrolase [Paenibacillus campi]|uniref:MBL fold metallo-hydrolase n=1 Tax=Paenibacillus campi TaxID=3106031 RepID=UPI002AFF207C|nr:MULTISPECIES: MBL fold metallo-hydrolase [unclassified Paenibacillus]
MIQIMQHLASHIQYLTPYQETDRPILAAITGTRSTLLIDAGNSAAHIQYFIDQLVKQDISPRWLVLTHWHWDHVFGMNQANTTIIAQTLTTEYIRRMQAWSWDDEALERRVQQGLEIEFCASAIKKELGNERDIILPTPDITFERKLELDLGRVHCVIEHVGGDHSDDSTVVYVKEDKVLFVGDALYPNIHVEPHEYTPAATLKLVAMLRAYDVDTVVLSHHADVWAEARFRHELDLLERIATLVQVPDEEESTIAAKLERHYERELYEAERETITLFLNGRHRQQAVATLAGSES